MSDGERGLGLKDVVVFNVCAIASFRWIAPAAHAGSVSLLLFVAAAALFLVPSGIVIADLTKRFPQEGGLYVWAKRAFGSRHGFLCSWFYFISNLFYFPSLVLFAVSTMPFLFGAKGSALSEQRAFAIPVTLALLWALFAANFLGMKVARWIQTLGVAAIFLVVSLIVAVAAMIPAGSGRVVPVAGFDALNLFSVIAFAFVGLELAPILSGEIQNPGTTIRRAAIIAGAACLLFYVSGTGALLRLMRAEDISPITGLVQAGWRAQGVLKVPGFAVGLAALTTFSVAAQLVTWIAGNTRLPYVLGMAHYLPDAFARLHPRWGTPYVSLLVQAVVATMVLLMAQLGETVRAAYQIMLDMLVVATFIPFLYIFACGWRFSNRVAAICGLLITLLAMGLSMVPPSEVASKVLFEGKVVGGFVLVAVAGILLYRKYQRTSSLALSAAAVRR